MDGDVRPGGGRRARGVHRRRGGVVAAWRDPRRAAARAPASLSSDGVEEFLPVSAHARPIIDLEWPAFLACSTTRGSGAGPRVSRDRRRGRRSCRRSSSGSIVEPGDAHGIGGRRRDARRDGHRRPARDPEDRTLRLLVTAPEHLQRAGDPKREELALAVAFARKLGLRAVPVVVSDRSQLIPALRAGRGDVIVGSLAVTPERAEEIAFTRPVRLVAQQVVVPKADRSIRRPADLAGKTVTVRASSSYASTLARLQPRVKGLEIKPARETEDTFDLIQKVARGEEAITVADSDILAAALTFEPGVKAAFTLADRDLIAWGVRKENPALKSALDAFLVERALDRLQGPRGARGPRRHPEARSAPGAHPKLEHHVLPPPRGGARLRVRAGPRVRADARRPPGAGHPPVARGSRHLPPGGEGGSDRGGARRDPRAAPGVRVHDALQPAERDPRGADEGPHDPQPGGPARPEDRRAAVVELLPGAGAAPGPARVRAGGDAGGRGDRGHPGGGGGRQARRHRGRLEHRRRGAHVQRRHPRCGTDRRAPGHRLDAPEGPAAAPRGGRPLHPADLSWHLLQHDHDQVLQERATDADRRERRALGQGGRALLVRRLGQEVRDDVRVRLAAHHGPDVPGVAVRPQLSGAGRARWG